MKNRFMHTDTADQAPNYTELFWYAAYKGDIESLKFLLNKNPINVDYIFYGVTPLWIAVEKGHDEIVVELLRYEANAYFKDVNGQSVLWSAAEKGHTKIATLLLQKGAFINEIYDNVSPLWVAVQNNHIDTVMELIKNDCDINFPCQATGQTPLFKAALLGHTIIVDELIKANAHINYPDIKGQTALHAASSIGCISIIEKLIQAGADVNTATLLGNTPLFYANSNNHSNAANKLLEYGSLPDLSQSWLNSQFSTYLDFYFHLYPNYKDEDKAEKEKEIANIKKEIEIGLCAGYTKLRRFMKDIGQDKWLGTSLSNISRWNKDKKTLEENPKLKSSFYQVLFSTYFLHMLDPLRFNAKPAEESDLLKLKNSYEEVFRLGFVFKYDEITKWLPLLLYNNATIEIHSSIDQEFHVISLTENASGEFELFDSMASIGLITLSSLKDLIPRLKLLFEANDSSIGLGLTINLKNPSLEDKKFFSMIKNVFIDYLIAERIKNNEINLTDNKGSTSLFYAILTRDESTTLKLIENGAISHTGKELIPPIYLAAQIGNTEIVKKLLDNGCDISTKGKNNSPLLCIAVGNGHIELVKLLIKEKAMIDCINNDSETPLYIACDNGFYDIAKILIDSGANVNQKAGCTTPLAIAIEHGSVNIVNLLVESHADLSNVFENKSAIDLAKEKKQNDIITYLNSLNTIETYLPPTLDYTGEKKNSFIFFKANSNEGQDLIKNRHASFEAQTKYDKNFGLINIRKNLR